jgi:hypothetical protein
MCPYLWNYRPLKVAEIAIAILAIVVALASTG